METREVFSGSPSPRDLWLQLSRLIFSIPILCLHGDVQPYDTIIVTFDSIDLCAPCLDETASEMEDSEVSLQVEIEADYA